MAAETNCELEASLTSSFYTFGMYTSLRKNFQPVA